MRESCSAVRRAWIMSISLGLRAPSIAGDCSVGTAMHKGAIGPRPADLATSASQGVNAVVRQSARPSVLSASHSVHPVGVRQHVEAHISECIMADAAEKSEQCRFRGYCNVRPLPLSDPGATVALCTRRRALARAQPPLG